MLYDLTVIIPTFNEEENIEKMVVTVDAICRAHNITEEILVVDDSSSDNTAPIVKRLMSEYSFLNLIIRTHNPGLSPSLYDGIINAKADLIQCIDCDFSHPPEKIPVFYQILKQEGYDMVMDKAVLLYAGDKDDLTSRVISELDKVTPSTLPKGP
jgi:dolichol-phosphate mannosyltransferase